MISDDMLNDYSREVRATAETLRRLFHATMAGMTARAYPGWHAIGFRHPKAG